MSSSEAEQAGTAGPRVVWLHSHFLLPTGGTKFIFEVVRRLHRRMPVEVVVEEASPLWRERYADEGIVLREIGGPTSSSMRYWAGFPAYLRRDLRFLREHVDPATTVVSSFFPMPWLASRLARRTSQRHVTLCFEPFPFFHDAEVKGLYPPAKRALLKLLTVAYSRMDRAGILSADALLTLNEATAKQVSRVYGRDDAIETYAGVDVEFFHPYPPEQLKDLSATLGPGPFVIHSTDFSPIKRTDLAVAAFAEAKRSVPDATMLVTSTRDDPAELAKVMQQARQLGVADSVNYLGFVPFEDIPRLYSLADVLLQSGTSAGSGATTMSLPVKEALACGTPVVRSGATEEDVEDGISGFLVDPRDSVTTGKQIAELLGDRARNREMGEAGRRRIVSLYTWERVTDVVAAAVVGAR